MTCENCKKCVHYDVCNPYVATNINFPNVEKCEHYKDKSLFVELPYEVGQIVYVIRSQTSNGKNLYLREERISHYRVFSDHIFMCFESERLSVANYQWKNVFLTEAEAERKLEELGV